MQTLGEEGGLAKSGEAGAGTRQDRGGGQVDICQILSANKRSHCVAVLRGTSSCRRQGREI